MNDSDLRQLADAAAQVLRPHLERSEALRRAVALIGKWLCEEAQRIDPGSETKNEAIAPIESPIAEAPVTTTTAEPAPPAPAVVVAEPAVPVMAVPPPLPVSSALVPLRLGDAVVHVPMSGTTEELGRARLAAVEPKIWLEDGADALSGRSEVELALVEERCRLKAASCRLFIEKRAAGAEPDVEYEVRQRMNEMIARAKTMPNCFLWVFWRERTPPDDATLLQIAESYDAHADAVALMRRIDESGGGSRSDDEASAFHLLAEANSALRVALTDTWLTDDDRDQTDMHIWLRQETASRRVFIERHMTADDPADPSNATDLLGRIKQIGKRLDDRAGRAKGVKSALSQIKYHAGQIVKSGSDDSSAHWTKIADAVAKLTSMGVAATDRRIAEAVGPDAAALWPAGSSDARGLPAIVGRAKALADGADRGLDDESASDDREWSKTVLDVRAMLRGKRMVIIGGERYAPAVERLTQAFELKAAEWVALTEHGSGIPMRAPIHRPDTAVVIVIVKLTGHLHAEEAREYASAAGKPCVLLSGGYNPERVAAEIAEQASARLKK
jgi:hypothetical protein